MTAHKEPKRTALENIVLHKWRFVGTFLGIFFLSLAFLQAADVVPSVLTLPREGAQVYELPTEDERIAVPKGEGELPILIEIPSVGVKATVSNPNTTDISALDRALLTGAVRYPGSGKLGEEGNVLLFGHSSYLPVVHNQAYKAFNGIQELEKGAVIEVSSEGTRYLYAVESVVEANTATGEIPLQVDGAHLTLATCDTFGAKSDRFIVTAVLVRVEKL